MNIYDLARHILELYDDSEQAALDERSMSEEKYNRKMKALGREVEGFYAQIKELQASDPVAIAEELLLLYEHDELVIIDEFATNFDAARETLARELEAFRQRIERSKG